MTGLAGEISGQVIKVRVCIGIPGQICCFEQVLLNRFLLYGYKQVIGLGICPVGMQLVISSSGKRIPVRYVRVSLLSLGC